MSLRGTNVCFTDWAEAHFNIYDGPPALSLVPDNFAPPNGCWPTTDPVDLSFT